MPFIIKYCDICNYPERDGESIRLWDVMGENKCPHHPDEWINIEWETEWDLDPVEDEE